MKAKRLLFIFPTMLLLQSCSCFHYEHYDRKQFLVEGSFAGDLSINSYDISETNCASLKVSRISIEEFQNANGVDVIKDVNGGNEPYFKLDFKILNIETNSFDSCHFYNLNDTNSPTCSYVDDNLVYLEPFEDGSGPLYGKYFYRISFTKTITKDTKNTYHYNFKTKEEKKDV